METTEKAATHTTSDVVAEALSATRRAEELKGAAIKQLLEQRSQIERDLKSLGYSGSTANGNDANKTLGLDDPEFFTTTTRPPSQTKRFRDMILAEVARTLILEHGKPLHGKAIERLAKAGGFTGGTNNFQNYLPVALKRDGGFENIGGNTWKLRETAR